MNYIDPTGHCMSGWRPVGGVDRNGNPYSGELTEGDAAVCELEEQAPPPPPSNPVTRPHQPVTESYYYRDQGGNYTPQTPQSTPSETVVAGVAVDKHKTPGKGRGVSFWGPAEVFKPEAVGKSPYGNTLALLDMLEGAADANGGTLTIKDSQGRDVKIMGRISFEQLVEWGLISPDGKITQHGITLLQAPVPKPPVKVTQSSRPSGGRGAGIVFFYVGEENVVDPDDIPDFEPVGAAYTTEVYFFNFGFWDLDSWGSARTTNLIHAVNTLREQHAGTPVVVVVDGSNEGKFGPYTGHMKADPTTGIKYCFVDDKGKKVLVIGLTAKQLEDAGIAKKAAGAAHRAIASPPPQGPVVSPVSLADFERHLKTIAPDRSISVVSVAPDQLAGAVPRGGIETRKFTSGKKEVVVFQVVTGASIPSILLSRVTPPVLDMLTLTTATAAYDAAKKTITASFVESGSSTPAKKAHIGRVAFVGANGKEATLKEGTDYTIAADGTITLKAPKTGTYRVYLQISGYPLDTPAEVRVGVKAEGKKNPPPTNPDADLLK